MSAALTTTYTVERFDHGPEPDWHKDDRELLSIRWYRVELVVRNANGDELARVRGTNNHDAWWRLGPALAEAMHWERFG